MKHNAYFLFLKAPITLYEKSNSLLQETLLYSESDFTVQYMDGNYVSSSRTSKKKVAKPLFTIHYCLREISIGMLHNLQSGPQTACFV